MKRFVATVTLCLLVEVAPLQAQSPPPPAQDGVHQDAEGAVVRIANGHADVLAYSPIADMGIKFGVQGAPFCMKRVQTSSRAGQPDGPRRPQLAQHRCRDGEGRERIENGMERDGAFHVLDVLILDRVAGFNATLFPDRKVARITHPTPPPPNAANAQRTSELQAASRTRREQAFAANPKLRESLGEQTVAGVRAQGFRSTFVLPEDAAGTPQDRVFTTEVWVAPDLKLVVGETQDDGAGRSTSSVVSDLVRGEPDPGLFRIPADYTVEDRSPPASAQNPPSQSIGTTPGNGNPPAGPAPAASFDPDGNPVRRIGGSVSVPRLLYAPEPEFSEEGQRQRVSGSVLVSLLVDRGGNPINIHVLRGIGFGLDEAAVEAVSQYRFRPAMENGQPVTVQMNVAVNFQISAGPH